MNRLLKASALALFAICAGCETLPPGPAPDGTIVEAYQPPESYSPKEAVNQMLTSITTRCEPIILAGTYVLMVKKEFNAEKNEDNRLPDQVAAELVKMKSIRSINLFPDAKYDWILQSNIKHTEQNTLLWEMKFISHADGKACWQETLVLKEKTVQKKAPVVKQVNSKENNETHIMERKRNKGSTEERLP